MPFLCRPMPIQACLFDIGNVLVTFDYTRTFPALAPQTTRTYEQIYAHLASLSTDLETGRLSSDDFIARALAYMGGTVTRSAFLTAFSEIFEPIAPVWRILESIRHRVPLYL